MPRRSHESGRSQPTNQSISQYKDTAETKLNCIALLPISDKIHYFYFSFLVEGSGKGGHGRKIKRWFYSGQNFLHSTMKKNGTIKTSRDKKLGDSIFVESISKEYSFGILASDQKLHL